MEVPSLVPPFGLDHPTLVRKAVAHYFFKKRRSISTEGELLRSLAMGTPNGGDNVNILTLNLYRFG